MYTGHNQWKEYDSSERNKEDEDTKEKLKALDDIKKDPIKADPELKELMKGTAELKAKLGEGSKKMKQARLQVIQKTLKN